MPRIQIDPAVIDSFKAALHETVTRSTMPAKSIADRLGVAYRTLLEYCDEASPSNLPSRYLPGLLACADNPALIVYLAHQAGRVTYPVPAGATASDQAMGALLRETGEALQEVSASLSDGHLSPDELDRCTKQLEDVAGAATAAIEALAQRVRRPEPRMPWLRASGDGR